MLTLLLALVVAGNSAAANSLRWFETNLPRTFDIQMTHAVWHYDTREVQVHDCSLSFTSILTVTPRSGAAEVHKVHVTVPLGAVDARRIEAVQSSTGTPTVLVRTQDEVIAVTSDGREHREKEVPLFFRDARSALEAAKAFRAASKTCK